MPRRCPNCRKTKKAISIHPSERASCRARSIALSIIPIRSPRIKGKAEFEILDLDNSEEELHGGYWQNYIAKPSMELEKQKRGEVSKMGWLSVFIGSVDVDELVAAMIDVGTNGSEEPVFNNSEVVMRGRAALDMDLNVTIPGM